MFKNHLEMIGRNETASKKARFWQSFVRSLKGSEDIRAEERYRPSRRSVYPELLSTSYPYSKSIYDDPLAASERITVPGYRYLPVHRETYGYSPRPIYSHNYPRSLERYRPVYHVPSRHRRGVDPFDSHKAWQEHLDRLSAIDRLYPSRYGLYLKDRAYPITDLSSPISTSSIGPKSLKGIEYEPDNKPHWGTGALPERICCKRNPIFGDAEKWADFDRAMREPSADRWSRAMSPTPVKPRISPPRDCEVAYDADGAPLYSAGGLRRRPWADIFNPSPSLPISAITRDPFWYDWPELKPMARWDRSPSYIRDSYLSPVKRTFLWDKHPIRPLDLMMSDAFTVDDLSRTLPFMRSL